MGKLLKWAIVAFLVFYVVTNPSGAGATAHHLLNGVHQAASSLSTFLSSL